MCQISVEFELQVLKKFWMKKYIVNFEVKRLLILENLYVILLIFRERWRYWSRPRDWASSRRCPSSRGSWIWRTSWCLPAPPTLPSWNRRRTCLLVESWGSVLDWVRFFRKYSIKSIACKKIHKIHKEPHLCNCLSLRNSSFIAPVFVKCYEKALTCSCKNGLVIV